MGMNNERYTAEGYTYSYATTPAYYYVWDTKNSASVGSTFATQELAQAEADERNAKSVNSEAVTADFEISPTGLPVQTETGIRCGNHDRKLKINHENIAAVRYCFEETHAVRAQIEEELAAEARNERFFEERGAMSALDDQEREAAMGLRSFGQAWHEESPDTCPCCH